MKKFLILPMLVMATCANAHNEVMITSKTKKGADVFYFKGNCPEAIDQKLLAKYMKKELTAEMFYKTNNATNTKCTFEYTGGIGEVSSGARFGNTDPEGNPQNIMVINEHGAAACPSVRGATPSNPAQLVVFTPKSKSKVLKTLTGKSFGQGVKCDLAQNYTE